jgi:hypothetical protein
MVVWAFAGAPPNATIRKPVAPQISQSLAFPIVPSFYVKPTEEGETKLVPHQIAGKS